MSGAEDAIMDCAVAPALEEVDYGVVPPARLRRTERQNQL